MRWYKPIQIGSKQGRSGDFTRWYLYNNLDYGEITAEVTDGRNVVSVSGVGVTSDTGEWSIVVRGLRAGRAIVTVTGTTPTSEEEVKESFLVEVKDKAKLRSGQAYQMADYR